MLTQNESQLASVVEHTDENDDADSTDNRVSNMIKRLNHYNNPSTFDLFAHDGESANMLLLESGQQKDFFYKNRYRYNDWSTSARMGAVGIRPYRDFILNFEDYIKLMVHGMVSSNHTKMIKFK